MDSFVNPDPENTDPCFVALDPSMICCGVAIARPSNAWEDFICSSGVITPKATASDAERIATLGAAIKSIDQHWPVEFIVVETPTTLYVKRGRSLDALKVLLALGAIYGAGGIFNCPIYGISVRDWKGAGQQFKEHSMQLATALWGGVYVEDEAEARLLALSVVEPFELRMAFGLLKLNAHIDKVLDSFQRKWSWGPRELERVELLGMGNRLRGYAGKKRSGGRLRS